MMKKAAPKMSPDDLKTNLGCWGLAEPSQLAFGCFGDSGIIEEAQEP